MGSTLETAIVFSTVLFVLAALIVMPADLICGSVDDVSDGFEELVFHSGNTDVVNSSVIGGTDCTDVSPERVCTFLTGISQNFRMITGAFTEDDD